MTPKTADLGMIGIGTMGRALLENMADHGWEVAAYTSNPAKAKSLSDEREDGRIRGFSSIEEFVSALKKPRAILLMVPAGAPVDETLEKILPLLEPGDLILDGGNSFYRDTDRREAYLSGLGFGFMGMGVSGGEEGARHGPSMMPGGSRENYERVKPILEAVSAKFEGAPCVDLMGKGSAGHYVKTVHNGIEYAMMQLIAETYDLLSRRLEMTAPEIGQFFGKLNAGKLGGFLVEIASTVLQKPDDRDPSKYLVDMISDKAKQKGTGKWTSQDAMDLGVPIPAIDSAVAARQMSALKPQRTEAEKILQIPRGPNLDREEVLSWVEGALHLAVLISYAQGFAVLQTANQENGYGSDMEKVAKIWRAGCIIRSRFLEAIRAAFERNPLLSNLLLDPEIAKQVVEEQSDLRKLLSAMIVTAIPAPTFSACLAYLDGFATSRLPANLIQAQRDLFGAHTYERLDVEGSFHTQWA